MNSPEVELIWVSDLPSDTQVIEFSNAADQVLEFAKNPAGQLAFRYKHGWILINPLIPSRGRHGGGLARQHGHKSGGITKGHFEKVGGKTKFVPTSHESGTLASQNAAARANLKSKANAAVQNAKVEHANESSVKAAAASDLAHKVGGKAHVEASSAHLGAADAHKEAGSKVNAAKHEALAAHHQQKYKEQANAANALSGAASVASGNANGKNIAQHEAAAKAHLEAAKAHEAVGLKTQAGQHKMAAEKHQQVVSESKKSYMQAQGEANSAKYVAMGANGDPVKAAEAHKDAAAKYKHASEVAKEVGLEGPSQTLGNKATLHAAKAKEIDAELQQKAAAEARAAEKAKVAAQPKTPVQAALAAEIKGDHAEAANQYLLASKKSQVPENQQKFADQAYKAALKGGDHSLAAQALSAKANSTGMHEDHAKAASAHTTVAGQIKDNPYKAEAHLMIAAEHHAKDGSVKPEEVHKPQSKSEAKAAEAQAMLDSGKKTDAGHKYADAAWHAKNEGDNQTAIQHYDKAAELVKADSPGSYAVYQGAIADITGDKSDHLQAAKLHNLAYHTEKDGSPWKEIHKKEAKKHADLAGDAAGDTPYTKSAKKADSLTAVAGKSNKPEDHLDAAQAHYEAHDEAKKVGLSSVADSHKAAAKSLVAKSKELEAEQEKAKSGADAANAINSLNGKSKHQASQIVQKAVTDYLDHPGASENDPGIKAAKLKADALKAAFEIQHGEKYQHSKSYVEPKRGATDTGPGLNGTKREDTLKTAALAEKWLNSDNNDPVADKQNWETFKAAKTAWEAKYGETYSGVKGQNFYLKEREKNAKANAVTTVRRNATTPAQAKAHLEATGTTLGSHGAKVMKDQNGNMFLAKPQEDWQSQLDVATNKLQHAAGIKAPNMELQQIDGKTASVQEMIDAKPAFPGGFDPKKLSEDDVLAIQKHQVLDILTGNHDGHEEQFLRTSNGQLLGIDQGQSFKFGLDNPSTYEAPGNFGTPVYTTLMDSVKAGETPYYSPNSGELKAFIDGVQNLPDDEFKRTFEPYASKAEAAGKLPDGMTKDQFLQKLTDKKNNLGEIVSQEYLGAPESNNIAAAATHAPSAPGFKSKGTPPPIHTKDTPAAETIQKYNATQEATNASAVANKVGSENAHLEAAKKHQSAADFYSLNGKSSIAGYHKDLAAQHKTVAEQLKSSGEKKVPAFKKAEFQPKGLSGSPITDIHDQPVTLSGVLHPNGEMIVHKSVNGKGYTVSSISTGVKFPGVYKNQKDAKAAADALAEHLPKEAFKDLDTFKKFTADHPDKIDAAKKAIAAHGGTGGATKPSVDTESNKPFFPSGNKKSDAASIIAIVKEYGKDSPQAEQAKKAFQQEYYKEYDSKKALTGAPIRLEGSKKEDSQELLAAVKEQEKYYPYGSDAEKWDALQDKITAAKAKYAAKYGQDFEQSKADSTGSGGYVAPKGPKPSPGYDPQSQVAAYYFPTSHAAGFELPEYEKSVNGTWKPAGHEETFGVYEYTGGSYTSINKQLRHGKGPKGGSWDSTIKSIDAAFDAVPPLDHGIVVSRKLDHNASAGTDGPFPKSPPPLSPGQTFTDKGYGSTSKNPTMWNGSVEMEIRIPAGKKAIDVEHTTGSQNEGELEILLPRNTQYRIISDNTVPNPNGYGDKIRKLVVEVI